MATWWELTFTGEPTEADFEHVSEMVARGFTSGQLVPQPGDELREGPATGVWAGPVKPLAWEPAGTIEPGDQNADTALVEHGYWQIGPQGNGAWTLTLVKQNAALDEVGGMEWPRLDSEADAKEMAARIEAGDIPLHKKGLTDG